MEFPRNLSKDSDKVFEPRGDPMRTYPFRPVGHDENIRPSGPHLGRVSSRYPDVTEQNQYLKAQDSSFARRDIPSPLPIMGFHGNSWGRNPLNIPGLGNLSSVQQDNLDPNSTTLTSPYEHPSACDYDTSLAALESEQEKSGNRVSSQSQDLNSYISNQDNPGEMSQGGITDDMSYISLLNFGNFEHVHRFLPLEERPLFTESSRNLQHPRHERNGPSDFSDSSSPISTPHSLIPGNQWNCVGASRREGPLGPQEFTELGHAITLADGQPAAERTEFRTKRKRDDESRKAHLQVPSQGSLPGLTQGSESSFESYDPTSPRKKRRRRLSKEARAHAAKVRGIGACANCRERKVTCKHVLPEDTSLATPVTAAEGSHRTFVPTPTEELQGISPSFIVDTPTSYSGPPSAQYSSSEGQKQEIPLLEWEEPVFSAEVHESPVNPAVEGQASMNAGQNQFPMAGLSGHFNEKSSPSPGA